MVEETLSSRPSDRKRAKPLTERFIKTRKPPTSGRVQYPDVQVTGLYLRHTDKAVMTWSVLYRTPGRVRPQRYTLGRYPAISLKEARSLAMEALSKVRRGGDPAAEKRAKRRHHEEMFEDVALEFVDRDLKPRQRRWQDSEAIIKRELIGRLRGRTIGSIKRADVQRVLDRKMDADQQRSAQKVLQLARRLFKWAIGREIIEIDPTAGIERPGKIVKRDRVLSEAELALVWQAAGEQGYPFGSFTRLLMLTAQRRSEVAGMRWPEVSHNRALWSIPSDRTKNQLPHDVPLSRQALAIVAEMPRSKNREGNLDDRAFPSCRQRSKGAISGFMKAKRKLDELMLAIARKQAEESGDDPDEVKPIAHWTFHDLRRSAVTRMADLGVQPHVIEAVVNHISGHKAGVAGIYNRSTYAEEKWVALQRWADYLEDIVAGERGKVIGMRHAE